jgi:hypothetical protein
MTAEIYSLAPDKENRIICKKLGNGEVVHVPELDIVAVYTTPDYTRVTFKDNADNLIENPGDCSLERDNGLISVNLRSGQMFDFCSNYPIKIVHVDNNIINKRRHRRKIIK